MGRKATFVLTDQQKIDIVNEYINNPRASCCSLGRIYEVKDTTIRSILIKRNIVLKTNKYSKYEVDSNYFYKINTEHKAYLLGFMYADGSVNDNGISIGLKSDDLEILELFKKELKFTGKLYFNERSKKNPNWSDIYRLSIYNKQISKDLINNGCIKTKTFKITFPNEAILPVEFQKHFLRGYFDGDGYVGYRFYKNKYLYISSKFVSTEKFCDKVSEIMKNELNINSYKETRHPERKHNIRQLSFSGNIQSLKFLDWIYKDSTVYLKRKYDKYLKCKELYSQQKLKKYKNESAN